MPRCNAEHCTFPWFVALEWRPKQEQGVPKYTRQNRQILLFVVAWFCVLSMGCRSSSHRTNWRPPVVAQPSWMPVSQSGCHVSALAMAESAYAAARQREANGDATCVDHYYQATTLAWPDIANRLDDVGSHRVRAAEIYRSALTRMIFAGQRFGRFDPRAGSPFKRLLVG